MHEFSMAMDILRIVAQEQGRHGFARVESVRLRAGALSGVDPHTLHWAFEAARQGTCAADATLEIEMEAAQLFCRSCGHRMGAHAGPSCCGQCGSRDLCLEGSSGFEILSLEVD